MASTGGEEENYSQEGVLTAKSGGKVEKKYRAWRGRAVSL